MNDVISRRTLWGDVCTLAHGISDEPWFVMGDFNVVLDMSESCGASGDIRQAMEEFHACIMEAGLITIPAQGEPFTWHNCSTNGWSLWKRLDRVLATVMQYWSNACYWSLAPSTSDYSPLLIHGGTRLNYVSVFRFDNYLASSPDFLDTFHSVWRHTIVGTTMFAVKRKVQALKLVFRALRQHKGDISLNVKLAREFLAAVQQLLARSGRTSFSCSLSIAANLSIRML
ncbi:uncharacterized protein LOC110012088 [Sesamum indicum]|uniref:Uncharacterized protein LOC110012088 n=1 Tax=Sesamum indicum TaxID=4182 RepID=A0A8M8V0Q8_SESIN|nr:uncharacterized protein LOC110012088 [Sesamum indicum]